MKIKATFITLVGSAISANAAFLLTGTDLALGDGSGITYSVTGDIGTEAGDGAGNDFRFSSNAGGSFTITFSGGTVDLSIFNSEINQGVNFDGTVANNAVVVADAGTWSYSAGVLNLTNSNNGSNSNVVSGLGTGTFTIGNARVFVDTSGNDDVANSGAPYSETDWGTFSISGVSSITYTYSNETNFDGFRIDAVAAVPEPSSTALLGLGGIALILRRRRA